MGLELNDSGKEKINQELEKIGLKIVRESKERCPVDTGRLRSSITMETSRLPNGLIRVTVGSNVKYAPHVEFGTIYQASQPFLRPAARQVLNKSSITSGDFSQT